MPEDILFKLKKSIKTEWKIGFFATLIIGLLTHLVVLTSYLPNHDGLVNFYSLQLKFELGRFFLGPASALSSFFDLSMINGLLSIIYMGFLVIVLIELLKLKKTLSIITTAGIIVTFPTVTSTFSYMFTADAYFLGYFLTALSVLITERYKWGFVLGALIFFFAVGVYQANLPFALTLIILLIILKLLDTSTWKTIGISLGKQIITLGSGMTLYTLLFYIYRNYGSSISSYQGLDEVGTNEDSFNNVLQRIKEDFLEFFLIGNDSFVPTNAFQYFNLFIILILIGFLISLSSKIPILRLILISIGILLIPIFTYSLYFVSPGVLYHSLMVMGLTAIYLVVVLFYDQNNNHKILSWASSLMLILTIFNFAIIANATYVHMQLRYEKSVHFANRLLTQIESHEEFYPEMRIGIVGRYTLTSYTGATLLPEKLPPLVGATGDRILVYPYHFVSIFTNVLGVQLYQARPNVLEPIMETEDFKNMPVWPNAGSIDVINEVMMIKLSDK